MKTVLDKLPGCLIPIIAFQIIPGIEGTRFSGHSNVCSGLKDEEPEARTTTLQPAVKEVAEHSFTELNVGISFLSECFLVFFTYSIRSLDPLLHN